MHKSCRAKEVCADLNSCCAVTSSLHYWHKMILYAFPNFCLAIPPLLVVCHLLHRCFSQAIARLFFKWLLPADVPQSPGVCVVLSTELKLSDALDILWCRCLFELQGPWQGTALISLLLPGCLVTLSLSNRPPCSPPGWLQTHYLGCTKQLSVLPEMNLCKCCGACAQKEELISPIIQAAKFYFPVETERKARCNS